MSQKPPLLFNHCSGFPFIYAEFQQLKQQTNSADSQNDSNFANQLEDFLVI